MTTRWPSACHALWQVPSRAEVSEVGSGVSSSSAVQFFAARRDNSSPEERADACLVEVVDSALHVQHQVAEKHRPLAEKILEGIPAAHRQETLQWLLQAFDVMHFNDSLVFDAALVLDRYYANGQTDESPGAAQRILLASVCTALKTGSPVEMQLPLKQMVMHLGRDQVPFEEVLVAELLMLRKLKFHVGTPTARDFMEGMWARLEKESKNEACWHLAEFLLQLAIIDAPLFYKFPHAILSSSCLVLAFQTTRAPQSVYSAMLEDLALQLGDDVQPRQVMLDCVQRIHQHWVRCLAATEPNTFVAHLCKKFSFPKRHSVSSFAPPSAPPVSIQPAACPAAPGFGDELEEAILLVQQSIQCREAFGAAVDYGSPSAPWAATLAARLSGSAERSVRLKSVLARHGWGSAGRFRRPPDLEALLRDLCERRCMRTIPPGLTRATPTCSSGASAQAASGRRRQRRAASWGGYRPPARTTVEKGDHNLATSKLMQQIGGGEAKGTFLRAVAKESGVADEEFDVAQGSPWIRPIRSP